MVRFSFLVAATLPKEIVREASRPIPCGSSLGGGCVSRRPYEFRDLHYGKASPPTSARPASVTPAMPLREAELMYRLAHSTGAQRYSPSGYTNSYPSRRPPKNNALMAGT